MCHQPNKSNGCKEETHRKRKNKLKRCSKKRETNDYDHYDDDDNFNENIDDFDDYDDDDNGDDDQDEDDDDNDVDDNDDDDEFVFLINNICTMFRESCVEKNLTVFKHMAFF